jgi:hypothetical protein
MFNFQRDLDKGAPSSQAIRHLQWHVRSFCLIPDVHMLKSMGSKSRGQRGLVLIPESFGGANSASDRFVNRPSDAVDSSSQRHQHLK